MTVKTGAMFQFKGNTDGKNVMVICEIGYDNAVYCESYNSGTTVWTVSEIKRGIKDGTLEKVTI